MKKASKKDPMVEAVNRIHEQLAVMDNKLDQFITKSLKDLAEAMAVVKAAARTPAPAAIPAAARPAERPGRPMFTVVCFDCGKDSEIPFKPAAGRPVYCKECFAKRRMAKAQSAKPGPQTVSLSAGAAAPSHKSAPRPAKAKPAVKKTAAKKKPAKKKTAKKK